MDFHHFAHFPLIKGIIPLNDSAGATIKVYGDKLLNRENEAYKSLQVSNRNEPCSRILLMALKKYKIEDDHQNYALFIQYSGQGNPK